jgi:hypothetical protein
MKELIDILKRKRIDYVVNGNKISVGGSLDLEGTGITQLPDNFSCEGLYLDTEKFTNVAYREKCGYDDRTIFAVWTGKEFRIAAGCFFGTLEQFEEAVDNKYSGDAAKSYKKSGQECVAELTVKLNKAA